MPHELAMPWLGPTVSTATIATWLVADGAFVREGQPIVVIDAAGSTTEVHARAEGTLEIRAEGGAVVPSGEVIAVVYEPHEVGDVVPVDDEPRRGQHGRILASPRARALARDEGIDIEGVQGHGPGGRIVHADVMRVVDERARQRAAEAERLAEAERVAEQDRVDAERRHAASVEAAEAAEAQAAAMVAQQAPEAPVPATAPPAEPPAPPADLETGHAADADEGSGVPATSAARQLADFLEVDLDEVPRTAERELTREDVGAWVRARLREHGGERDSTSAVASGDAPETNVRTEHAPLLQEPVEVVTRSARRSEIAERVHSSLTDMAQLTLNVDADMTAVNAERARRRAAGEVVPGYTAWVVAAAAQSITDHPYINAQLTTDGLAVLPDVHLGVTVALDEGQVVPVIEHADLRAVDEIHQVLAELAGRARNDRLEPGELDRATFSVTALGMFGVDGFTPVIHPPNTAVLGIGRLRSATAWRDGRPVETTVMTLSLTWDHRAFDSAPAAEFARTIVRRLETPAELV